MKCEWSMNAYSEDELNAVLSPYGIEVDDATTSLPPIREDYEIPEINSEEAFSWWRVRGAACNFSHPACSVYKNQFIRRSKVADATTHETPRTTMTFVLSTPPGGDGEGASSAAQIRTYSVDPHKAIITALDDQTDQEPGALPPGVFRASVELYSPHSSGGQGQTEQEQMTRFKAYGRIPPREPKTIELIPQHNAHLAPWSKFHLVTTSHDEVLRHSSEACGSVFLSFAAWPSAEKAVNAEVEVFVPKQEVHADQLVASLDGVSLG